MRRLYSSLATVVRKNDIHVLACVVNKDVFDEHFPEDIHNEISLVSMQIIIENFTHFLHSKNAKGKIIYESRDAMDKHMLMRHYQIASIGTIYTKAEAVQRLIEPIRFISKQKNNSCLQLADFIPSVIARDCLNLKLLSGQDRFLREIKRVAYSGNTTEDCSFRYGIKVIPRMSN